MLLPVLELTEPVDAECIDRCFRLAFDGEIAKNGTHSRTGLENPGAAKSEGGKRFLTRLLGPITDRPAFDPVPDQKRITWAFFQMEKFDGAQHHR